MQKLAAGHKLVLARIVDGRVVEEVEWIRHADTVWVVTEAQETVIGPDKWKQAWADLEARGFVEIYPTFRPQILADKERVLNLVRTAFQGVTLGDGIGLRQANGLDDYADAKTLAALRAEDEKSDWSSIPVHDLHRYGSSPSFFDAEGMRFHLPAYLVADLQGALTHGGILFHLVYLAYEGKSRFEMLTDSQRHAVREFLLLRLSDHDYEFQRPLIERALREYWVAEEEG